MSGARASGETVVRRSGRGWVVAEGRVTDLEVIEICAGAGGQAPGLERSGFEHALAVEPDPSACVSSPCDTRQLALR